MDEFLAKSKPEETITEHTEKLLNAFSQFSELYGEYFSKEELEAIKVAAQYHDYGKCSLPFQNKVLRKLGKDELGCPEVSKFYKSRNLNEIPHGYLSPAFLDVTELEKKFGKKMAFAIINAIYYHHTRKTDFTDKNIADAIENDLKVRLNDKYKLSIKYLTRIFKDGSNPDVINKEKWECYALVKGILNRLDYAARSEGKAAIEIDPCQNGKYISQLVSDKWSSLRDVQLYMQSKKDKNLIVTASTGIGKTEAALLWIDKSKAFYTLPLKVSINAIYERIVKDYGYSKEKATLLHSDALSYLLKNEEGEKGDEDPFLKYNQAKIFSYPLTVCTVDQLFRFVYKYIGCEMIPATLKYSKLVIDEIQSYSPDIIAKLIYGLKIITEMGGKFAIITATFPPVLEYFMEKEGLKEGRDYEKPEPFFSTVKSRHFLRFCKGDFDYEKIIGESKNKKVLVLCNTVGKAQKVFHDLQKQSQTGKNANIHLLHSCFLKKHRAILEKSIEEFTKGGNKDAGIWISTQIVEASLDIDFDMLFTEMCSADSLLQRLGRCYRKREYKCNVPNVFVYDTGNGKKYIYDDDIYDLSVKYIEDYCERIFAEEEKLEYINKVYSVENLKGTSYYRKLNKSLNAIEKVGPNYFTEKDAEEDFRHITAKTVIPDNVYSDMMNSGKFDGLVNIIHDKKAKWKDRLLAKDELLENTISVSYSRANMADESKCCNNPDIYRIQADYDFDEVGETGMGLVTGKETDEGNNTANNQIV